MGGGALGWRIKEDDLAFKIVEILDESSIQAISRKGIVHAKFYYLYFSKVTCTKLKLFLHLPFSLNQSQPFSSPLIITLVQSFLSTFVISVSISKWFHYGTDGVLSTHLLPIK